MVKQTKSPLVLLTVEYGKTNKISTVLLTVEYGKTNKISTSPANCRVW